MNIPNLNKISDDDLKLLIKRLDEFQKKRSNLPENINDAIGRPIAEDPFISKVNQIYWHSVNGRILALGFAKLSTQIDMTLAFITGSMAVSWINYNINLTNLKSQNLTIAVGLCFLFMFFWNLTTTVFNNWRVHKMGGIDSLEFETYEDKEKDKLSKELNNFNMMRKQNNI